MPAVAAESGVERARRFRAKAEQAQRQADEAQKQADHYRQMADNCEKGAAGEQEVARLLDVLDGAGWRVLNDRYKSPTSPVNIDHIAVGPPGVLVIDAKHWAGGPVRLDERGMTHRGRRRDEELDRVRDAVETVGAHARKACADVPTCGVIAFVGEAGPAQPVSQNGVTVLRSDQLLGWLTDQPARSTPQQVQQIGSTLDAALPPRTGGPGRPLTLPAAMPAHRPARTSPARAPARTGSRRRPERQALPAASPLRRQLLKAALALFLVLVVLPGLLQSLATGVTESLQQSPPPPPVRTVPAPVELPTAP